MSLHYWGKAIRAGPAVHEAIRLVNAKISNYPKGVVNAKIAASERHLRNKIG